MSRLVFLLSAALAVFPSHVVFADPLLYFPQAENKTTYESWILESGDMYQRNFFLPSSTDSGLGAAVFWTIHDSGESDSGVAFTKTLTSQPWIQFAVAVQASGWVGFGLSEAGGMLGSDMAIFDSAHPATVRDAYVVEGRIPQTDDCQDWVLKKARIDEGWIIIEIARALDTGDPQDHRIMDDSVPFTTGARLIAAWGNNDFGYHGPNVARSAVKLFANQDAVGSNILSYHKRMETEAAGYFDVRESDFSIPQRETTYNDVCINYSELLSRSGATEGQSITIIGMGALVMEETAAFLHHFVLYSSREADSCSHDNIVYAWAPGEGGMEVPFNVGIPMFGDDEPKTLKLEMHFNNPGLAANQLDSSGVRIYFSLEPREHTAGMLQLGDPLLRLSQPIGEGLTRWSFECAPSCSAFALEGKNVTVLFESLHMHKSGTRMVNEVIRDNEVVHNGFVDVFEFDQQGSYRVPTGTFDIQPGDGFRTTCYYRDGTAFGRSSQEEMCIAFLLYYPAKTVGFGTRQVPWSCVYGLEVPICQEELSSSSLASEEELGRTFGSSTDSCEDHILPNLSPEIAPTMSPEANAVTPTGDQSAGGGGDVASSNSLSLSDSVWAALVACACVVRALK